MEMEGLNNNITERRKQTRSAVFNYIYEAEEPRTKQEISRDLNLSLPTVYQNVEELLHAGYLEYSGARTSSGGRPAMALRVVSSIRYAIGINITADKLRFAATDLSQTEIAYKSVVHGFGVGGDDFNRFLASELELFIDESGISRERILGVGITLAGIILPESNVVLYAPTLYLNNVSLDSLARAIPYPVHTENDANSGGFAEWTKGAKESSVAFLSLEDGVGGSLFVNGEPYAGNHNRSGEFGHICVERNGRKCACGKQGCLEAYCSAIRLRNDFGADYEEFFEQLKVGNPKACEIWEDYKHHLATGVHNIRMVLDCDVILGGFMAEHMEPYIPEIREILAEEDPFDSENGNYLRSSLHPKYSSIIGVAMNLIREFISGI